MKNKNGFTLIEVLAAIIILGILLVITVPTFTKYLKGFRLDYYERLEGNVNTSAQTFFADNRSYRPIGLLETSIVKLGTLDSEKYIEEVKDYNGANCDSESYVIVIKEGKGKYHYETCLKCSKDNYESGKDYCSDAWLRNDNLEFVLEEGPTIYIYQGTPRSELKEKLKIKAWVQKTDGIGNVLATIDGKEDETGEVPEIYPDDIDTVNTDVLGEYPVTYTYGDKTTTGKVIVYKNNAPIVKIQTENNGVKKDYDDTDQHDWGQKLHFDFEAGDELFDKANTNITAVQWRREKTKKWEDFCIPTDGRTCYRELTTEMNENVDFRFVSNETDYSDLITKKIKIDNTAPTVKITVSGTSFQDDWYNTDITYGFKQPDTKDNVGPDGDTKAVSGIVVWGISTTNPNDDWEKSGLFNLTGITGTQKQTTDTSGTEWYAYIEDDAENRAVVSHTAKRDTVKPTISWDPATGEHNDNDGFTATGTCQDERSGVYTDDTYKGSVSEAIGSPTSSSGVTLTITCKDNAGNTESFSGTYKVKHYYSNDCDKCGESTCTDSGCCGTESCNCSTNCVCWDYANDYVCGSGSYSSGKQCSCDVNCTTTCSTCAKTCTSSCCGCESCWNY